MVSYCCVRGCNNNSKNKTKDPSSKITFHALPSNPELRSKWLKAIGRPNWKPPLHYRLCSVHFDNEQLKREGFRTRIKEDACPTKHLPVNSNFEVSASLEVCRICLATDVKMYSLNEGMLKTCIEDIHGLIENFNIEGMPHFICYECGACLMKFYRLLEKSMIAQATLLDIFAIHGRLTMSLIKKRDRKQINLTSSLGYDKTMHIYEFTYGSDDQFLSLIKTEDSKQSEDSRDIDSDDDYLKFNDNKLGMKNEDMVEMCDYGMKMDVDDKRIIKEEDISQDSINTIDSDVDNNHDFDCNDEKNVIGDDIYFMSMDDVLDDYSAVLNMNSTKQTDTCDRLDEKSTSMKRSRKSNDGLSRSIDNMQQHFDIVKLSLEEQIEEWRRTRIDRALTSETIFKCEICYKVFAHIKSYRNHIAGHDPSRGPEECPVCKLRFKTKIYEQTHRYRTHGNKLYCKECPKVFSNVTVARKHYRWHIGHRYKCRWCSFSSAHESAVGAHVRTSHVHAPGTHACARCGLACRSAPGLALHYSVAHKDQSDTELSLDYKCESCDVYFASEGARRVHLLTSRHKKLNSSNAITLELTLKNTCIKCGEEFPSSVELETHMETKHRKAAARKPGWRRLGDIRPTLCEHCGETVKNRRALYWHVLKKHPSVIHLYQPAITAVCEICGKGFQNSTKLHMHELRHGQPTVKCAHCPRMFYDKHAAAIHGTVHESAKPYACRTCGRKFKLKANLHRHSRVHSTVAPYECSVCGKKYKYSYSVNLHVRTVHHKMPYPQQKKRKVAKKSKPTDNNNI